MNNEIKEILEDIKRIQKSDYDKLLDYITNLQEENKNLCKKLSFKEKCRRTRKTYKRSKL